LLMMDVMFLVPKKIELNQLSHAYLFTGAKEIGKKEFALEFAEFVGCKFPDLMIVKAEDGGEIEISQIRKVQNFLSYKSYHGGYKIVIVEDAEKMNTEAQNCFLKSLEEPKGNTLLILISTKPDILLPTIISRSQTIKFFAPKDLKQNPEKFEKEQKILNDLLSVAGSNFAEKFKYVKNIDFEKENATDILEVMQKYLRHLLMIKIGVEKSETKDTNFQKYSVKDLKKILNLVEDISQKLNFTNASPKLALEILLMEL